MPLNFIGKRRRDRPARGLALWVMLLWQGLAMAADPATIARYVINQPAQPLSESLRAIAHQTGVSVLFDPSTVSGRMSPAVSGQLSAAEAIARVLGGTGLTAEVTSEKSIVVRPASAASAPLRAVPVVHLDDAVRAESASVRLADASSSGGTSSGTTPEGTEAQQLQKVEVTGSRLKRVEADGPMPVNVYTRADIDRSGQPTLERFLSSLSEASISPGEGGAGSTTGQGSVQLRGLPLGSTLVLINGRRVQAVGSSSAANYFNLNLIPMAAIERIEVVPVGSSAVYGGDALAGVVNIILKKSIDGFALDTRLASAKGTGDGNFSLATGRQSENGSFLLLGSYSKTTPLTMAERGFFLDGDFRRFGGVDARTRSCTPGTVTSTTGGNLPGLESNVAGIPGNPSGQPLTTSSFAATAGQPNLCYAMANGNGTSLVYGTEDLALHAAGERHLGSAWSLFGELTYTRDRLRAEQSGLQLNNALVPAANPYNPFGQAVRVTGRLGPDNGVETFVRNTNFTRVLVGVNGELGAGWELEASLASSRDDGQRNLLNTTTNSSALNAALGSTNPDTSLNPFTTGRAANDAVLRSIWTDTIRDNHGRKDQASAFVRGSPIELPMGKVDVIAGAELSHDSYRTATVGSFDIADSRSSDAVYGEMRVPLWRSAPASGSAWDLAALAVAGRRDKYSDFGGATTYQAGAELRPARTLLLRGSFATSFKPPTLLQMNVDDASYTTDLFGLVDPKHGNAPIVGGEVVRATNTSLQPEKGRAFSLGAVWEPESSAGTRIGVTAWRVKIKGLISLLWPQVTLDHEDLFPGFVTRATTTDGTPGAVTSVLYSEVNYGGVETAGTDLELSHSWNALGAKWTAGANATRASRYDVQVTPASAAEDRLGRRSVDYWAPKWKGRLLVGLDQGVWSLGWTGRYLGAYKDVAPSDRSLGAYWVHDLAGTLNLKRLGIGLGFAKEASLALAIANVGDRLPEYVGASPYYDITQADWRGRYASLRFAMTW